MSCAMDDVKDSNRLEVNPVKDQILIEAGDRKHSHRL
jgi:hypothetical protein